MISDISNVAGGAQSASATNETSAAQAAAQEAEFMNAALESAIPLAGSILMPIIQQSIKDTKELSEEE